MRVLEGPHEDWAPGPAAAVTVGVLDGVHLGHRYLLGHLVADGLVPTVATFEPHPIEVLVPGEQPRLITTVGERIQILEGLGVQQVAVLDLSRIRELSPEEFVGEVLVRHLNAKRIVAGVDFQFGKNRTGTVALLKTLGGELGYEADVLDLVIDEGVVSSSRIRGLIESGAVEEAAGLLGSGYLVTNEVVAGDGRGRDLGMPTANLEPPPRKVIPGNGVYAALAEVGGAGHAAAVNVGVRPTFDGPGHRLIEAHLLDFEGDIYGEDLTLEFVARLRDEIRFDSIDELVAQMHRDVAETRARLATN